MVSLIAFLIFIYSIILHEIAHGWVADRLGDPTARFSGRLTLKPWPHIDPLMSILLPFFLYFTGSPVIIGSAKPVPIDPYNLRNIKKDMGLIGLAGPATNLLIALCLSLIARLSLAFFPSQIIYDITQQAAFMNIILAVFNLIPIPPLDGGRVAVALLPSNYSDALASLENYGMMIVLFLLLFPILPIQPLISSVANFIFKLFFPGLPTI